MYDIKLKEYKAKQKDILAQMSEYTEADEEFYVTTDTVFNLGKRAVEIFESSEPQEKQQLSVIA